jgi:predicted dienelactone hydrolase
MTMRMAASLLGLFLATWMGGAAAEAETFKVGVTTRLFIPSDPYEWRAAQTHGLRVTVWYPAAASATEAPQWIGPPDAPLFSAGRAAPEAALAPAPAKFPLIVMSHGTGGTGPSLGWLGTALAARGYVVAAVNHLGNNATEPYTVQGFSLWWERARDISVVIDGMLEETQFAPRIDAQRIGGAGFSLGGYTMVALAGGITDRSLLADFCRSPGADATCKAPPEFPGAGEKVEDLAKSDPAFREALERQGRSYRDPRIHAIFVMAPALGPAFVPLSLGEISIPVAVVAGEGDKIVPISPNAQRYAASILNSRLTLFPGGVGHYTFLGACSDAGRQAQPMLCNDAPGVDREAIHAKTIELATTFFSANLR